MAQHNRTALDATNRNTDESGKEEGKGDETKNNDKSNEKEDGGEEKQGSSVPRANAGFCCLYTSLD